jgi:hypothetical protein
VYVFSNTPQALGRESFSMSHLPPAFAAGFHTASV